MSSNKVLGSEFLTNAKEDAVSPFTTDAITIAEVGGGLTVLTLFLKKGNFEAQIAKNRPLGNSSKIGYFLGQAAPNLAYVLIMGSHYLISDDVKSFERSTLMLKASLYSDVMTEIFKRGFNEKRPNGGSLSFPSGHATSAFAFSSIITMEHSEAWGIAANTMAAFVGFSRMNDNAHYLHDVIGGATIGAMYGVGLYYAQQKREEINKTNSTAYILLPIKDGLMGKVLLSL